jgi:hypothetical protein
METLSGCLRKLNRSQARLRVYNGLLCYHTNLFDWVIFAVSRCRYDAPSGRRGRVIEQATPYSRRQAEPSPPVVCVPRGADLNRARGAFTAHMARGVGLGSSFMPPKMLHAFVGRTDFGLTRWGNQADILFRYYRASLKAGLKQSRRKGKRREMLRAPRRLGGWRVRESKTNRQRC